MGQEAHQTPTLEPITDRLTSGVILSFLPDGPPGLPERTVELLIHLTEHLVKIAVDHGAPTDPVWWDTVSIDLATFADWLTENAQ